MGTPIWQMVTALFAGWHEAKMVIERGGAVSTDALHVIAGVLLQLVFALVFRRPMTSWLPWSMVTAVLIFNEFVDFWVERWPSLAMQLTESAKDLTLTMLLPTALLLALRFWPGLGSPRPDGSYPAAGVRLPLS